MELSRNDRQTVLHEVTNALEVTKTQKILEVVNSIYSKKLTQEEFEEKIKEILEAKSIFDKNRKWWEEVLHLTPEDIKLEANKIFGDSGDLFGFGDLMGGFTKSKIGKR